MNKYLMAPFSPISYSLYVENFGHTLAVQLIAERLRRIPGMTTQRIVEIMKASDFTRVEILKFIKEYKMHTRQDKEIKNESD